MLNRRRLRSFHFDGRDKKMAIILTSYDYGRRAEYLTSVLLSPYALTIPIRGHDDRVQSDFLCVGLEEEKRLQPDGSASPSVTSTAQKSLIPDLKLLFWAQTKSQSTEIPQEILIESPSNAESVFYFAAKTPERVFLLLCHFDPLLVVDACYNQAYNSNIN